MSENIDTLAQTLGPKVEVSEKKETAPKQEEKAPVTEPQGKTFTQAELDAIVKERLEREKKKFVDYTDLKAKAAKYEEAENAKLKDDEKAAKRLKDLEDKIAAKEKELADRILRDLKRAKIEQAIADGKMVLPQGKTVDSLVKRCLGTTEEEVDSDVVDLIGFFPPKVPEPTPKGLGTATKTGEATKPTTLDDQIAELNVKMRDPKLSQLERQQLAAKQVALTNRKLRGET